MNTLPEVADEALEMIDRLRDLHEWELYALAAILERAGIDSPGKLERVLQEGAV